MNTYPFGFPKNPPQIGDQIIIGLVERSPGQFVIHIFRRRDEGETLAFDHVSLPQYLVAEIASIIVSLNECLLSHNMRLRIDEVRMATGETNEFAACEVRQWVKTPNPTISTPRGFVEALKQVNTITTTIIRSTT